MTRQRTGRTAARLAWALWAGLTAVACLGIAFVVANRSLPGADPIQLAFSSGVAAITATYAGAGALIASRQPRNPVGWLLIAVGGGQALGAVAEYGRWGLLVTAQPAPLAAEMLWLGSWTWMPSLALLVTFLPLLFPTGRLPSPRWRPVAAVAATAITVTVATSALFAWPLRGPRMLDSGVEPDLGTLEVLVNGGTMALALAALAAAISVVVRYRCAGGVERQQLKWVSFGAAITGAGVVASFFDPFWTVPGLVVVLAAFHALPVTVGVAILRYRLYDIDRLLSRTMAYALLTGVLAGVYLTAVVVLQALLAPIAGPSELAVAGATLAAAAAFAPARRRLQTTVDRRFNRARYDARRTVTAFRERLRGSEISHVHVCDELIDAVDAAVEPAAVTVWLRGHPPGTPS